MSSSAPFVILCANCSSILSDSSCNISTNEELQVFISDKTTNIEVGKELKLAIGQRDEGSSYFDISCSSCQSIIGKVYRSTTDVTDAYRDKNVISFNKVKTYVLGSCCVGNSGSNSGTNSKGPSGVQSSNSILLSFDAERAANDSAALKEIRAIILHLSKRVEKMESKQL